jgi:hypothetical protein
MTLESCTGADVHCSAASSTQIMLAANRALRRLLCLGPFFAV